MPQSIMLSYNDVDDDNENYNDDECVYECVRYQRKTINITEQQQQEQEGIKTKNKKKQKKRKHPRC